MFVSLPLQNVSKSSKLTDQNMSSLSNESAKLQESSKKAWKCWMWLMIGLVMMIFICKYSIDIFDFNRLM